MQAQLVKHHVEPGLLCCQHPFVLCVAAGAAFLNGQLITAGADGNICIWALMAAQDNSNSSTHCTDSMLGAVSAQQQQQQRSAGVSSGSAAAATLGSWLESRRAAGAAAGVAAGGVIVAQPQQVQVDAGKQRRQQLPKTIRGASITARSLAHVHIPPLGVVLHSSQ